MQKPCNFYLLFAQGFLLAGLLISAFIPAPLYAQEAVPRYTMVFRGIALDQALESLATKTKIDLGYDPNLVLGKKAHCIATDQDAEHILSCILMGSGLDYVKRSSGLYYVIPSTRTKPQFGDLSGIVIDSNTGEPLVNAHVILAEPVRGEATNEAGFFSFSSLPPGTYQIRASYVGYSNYSTTINILPGGLVQAELPLDAEPVMVSPIIIQGFEGKYLAEYLGSGSLSQEEYLRLPAAGTADVIQSLDAISGVRVSDVTSDIYVQGGNAGEHEFRLDGAPVYIPLNFAGFIGPFSPFAFNRITIHKAGFGTSLGSQISGVIQADHALHNGQKQGQKVSLQIDPLSFNGKYSLKRDQSGKTPFTVMVAARYGLWKLFAPSSLRGLLENWDAIDTFLLSAFADTNTPFSDLSPVGNPSINFYDVHAATRIRLGPLKSVHISAYGGGTRLGSDLSDALTENPSLTDELTPRLASYQDVYSWQNGVFQSRYETIVDPRTLASVRARASYYRLKHNFTSPDSLSVLLPEDDGNRTTEVALEGVVDRSTGHNNDLRLGTELILTSNRFIVAGTQQLPLQHKATTLRGVAYAEDMLSLGSHVVFTFGSRFTYLHARRTVYAEPRISLRFDWPSTPVGGFSLFLGTGIYRQFVNQFDVSSRSPRTFVTSSRFWMATDSSIAPPKARHLAAEFLYYPTSRWVFRVEGYYKKLDHLLSLNYASSVAPLTQSMAQSDFLRSSNGYAYGTAVELVRKFSPGRILARYEYNISRRTISDLYQDELHNVPWNEPHRVELALDVMPIRNLSFLIRWRGRWGKSWGFRKAYYDFLSANLDELSSLLQELSENGVSQDALTRVERQITFYELYAPEKHKLIPFHQLDLSFGYTLFVGGMSLQARIDVLNVLNRENVSEWRFALDPDSYYDFDPGSETSGILERVNRPMLPRVTTVAFKLSW